jgi:hypothetical protein
MDKNQIKKLILDIAGNPSSGAIKDLAPVWAEAIESGLNPVAPPKIERVEKESKEVRVQNISETR